MDPFDFMRNPDAPPKELQEVAPATPSAPVGPSSTNAAGSDEVKKPTPELDETVDQDDEGTSSESAVEEEDNNGEHAAVAAAVIPLSVLFAKDNPNLGFENLPDHAGVKQGQKPSRLVGHQVVTIKEAIKIRMPDGTEKDLDPTGSEGVHFILRAPDGGLRWINGSKMDSERLLGKEIIKENGQRAQQTAGFGSILAALTRKWAESRDSTRHKQIEESINANQPVSFARWQLEQSIKSAQEARHSMNLAKQANERILRNDFIRFEMDKIRDLNKVLSSGALSVAEGRNVRQAINRHSRNVSRLIQNPNNLDLGNTLKEMRNHLKFAREHQLEAMKWAERNGGLTDELRLMMPSESDWKGAHKGLADLTEGGRKSKSDEKLMEQISKMAEQITEAIKNMLSGKPGAQAAMKM